PCAGDRPAAGGHARTPAGAGDERDDRPTVRRRGVGTWSAADARGLAQRAEGGASSGGRDVRADDRHAAQRILRRRSDHRMAGTWHPDAAGAPRPRHLPRGWVRGRGRGVSRAGNHDLRCGSGPGRSARERTRIRGGGRVTRRAGALVIIGAALCALAAPLLAPHTADARDGALLNAPPTWPHLVADDGSLHAPFIYRWRLVSRLEQRYEEDRSASEPLTWFAGGHLVQSSNETDAPFLLLGADSFGRDVLSRLLYGARISLGLAAVAALGATLLGAAVGGLAGYRGGTIDDLLMRGTDF